MNQSTPTPNTEEIPAIAMPGTHQRFLPFFQQEVQPGKQLAVLDIGAGHGAFTKRLDQLGYQVRACDLFPELFRYEGVECLRVNINEGFPYPDDSFDVAVAIEVMEHIFDHEIFFKELHRILKPGGQLFLSTPNILSIKSRLRFLLSGFYYSFQPLDHNNHDGLQHVSALTLDQYNYVAIKSGFGPAKLDIDKRQKSSRWGLILYPFLWLYTRLKGLRPIHNRMDLLVGRLLFLRYESENDRSSSPKSP